MTAEAEERPYRIGVHATHCCPKHGCKYGHADCPVRSGEVAPEYPPDNGCEMCEYEEEEFPQIRRYEFMVKVLGFFWENDITEDLMWSVTDGKVRFSAKCSDVFHWASADSEDIGPDDLRILQDCLDALKATGTDCAEVYTAELYAARKRGMRPMRKWLDQALDLEPRQPLLDLFLASGPERTRESEG